MNKYSPEVVQLRLDIESQVGFHPTVPADFERLILVIWEKQHENIALSTLERLWSYVDGAENTRLSTLNLLSQFLGYADFSEYTAQLSKKSGGSYTFLAEGLYTRDLQVGAQVDVTWLPNRHCVFVYRGGMQFEVILSENATLQVGDTFLSAFFLKGNPMYADCLSHDGKTGLSYVAGTNGGLVSVRLYDLSGQEVR